MTFFLEHILQSQMTVEKDQFRAFFRMVPQKLAICGKNGRFRATSYKIKIVENAILKTFYLMTFFSRCILQPQMTVVKYQLGIFQNGPQKIGHLWQKLAIQTKRSLHKSCRKCNFEDFLFYDFFSQDASFSHK